MFKIGQKVVCKDVSNSSQYSTIKLGSIYTILDIVTSGSGPALILDTEENGQMYGFPFFWGYRPDRFEPLKYDLISNMDIIKEMIPERLDVPEKEPAELQDKN